MQQAGSIMRLGSCVPVGHMPTPGTTLDRLSTVLKALWAASEQVLEHSALIRAAHYISLTARDQRRDSKVARVDTAWDAPIGHDFISSASCSLTPASASLSFCSCSSASSRSTGASCACGSRVCALRARIRSELAFELSEPCLLTSAMAQAAQSRSAIRSELSEQLARRAGGVPVSSESRAAESQRKCDQARSFSTPDLKGYRRIV